MPWVRGGGGVGPAAAATPTPISLFAFEMMYPLKRGRTPPGAFPRARWSEATNAATP